MSNSDSVVTLTLLDFPANIPLQQWSFPQGSAIRVGRATDNDVVIENSRVSRYHLELLPGNSYGSWQVVNQGVNGTFLNNVLTSRAILPEEGLLQLAKDGPVLQFEVLGSSAGGSSSNIAQSTEEEASTCSHAGNPATNLFCIHCGQLLATVQQTIANYSILRTLGQGGMGITYLALDPTISQRTEARSPLLVLKEMNADLQEIEKAQELFTREARVLQGLDHPGIPSYYASFIDRGKKFLAMELVQGQDLETLVVQEGAVKLARAIEWIQQTCQILDYLHTRTPPLIHRDIKPANLMVRSPDNQIVLLDFGAVKELGTPLKTKIGAEGGYSAPEQNYGHPCTQSDIYALGPTLIFLLTGKSPLEFYTKLGNSYGFDFQNAPQIPSPVRAIIQQVTQIQPRDRPQTALEVAATLGKCL